MSRLQEMFDRARQSLEAGQFGLEDLEQLRAAATTPDFRQRLLYLYAMQPSVRANLVATTLHDPHDPALCQIDPLAPDLPYQNVMDAILDGWRVIHFPHHRAAYQEGKVDMLGYEFILEQLVPHDL